MTLGRCIEGSIELPGMEDRRQPTECPEAALLCAVLHRAWIDALDRFPARALTGLSSRAWWTDRSPGLRYICEALGLDLGWVVTRAHRRLAEYDAGDVVARRRIRGASPYEDRGEEDYVSEHDQRDPGRHRDSQRLYYLAHRETILQRRRIARRKQAQAEMMEERHPGYGARHPRRTQPG